MAKDIKKVKKGQKRPFEFHLSTKTYPKAGGDWSIWASSRKAARKKLVRHARKIESGKWKYSK